MNCPASTTSNAAGDTGVWAYIGLGSNQDSGHGSPEQTIEAALRRLAGWSAGPLRHSSLWRSEPVDCPPGSPPFINAVAAMLTNPSESAHQLLEKLLSLESEFGRRRDGTVNAPRSLDLDLLCFGAQQSADDTLVVPHPRAHQRGFVLLPLAEIAADLRLPGQDRTVAELAARLPLAGPRVTKLES